MSIREIIREEEPEELQLRPPEKQYIRIFKDTTDPEVWKSYCLGFGLDPETTQSFKIKNIDTASDVQIDIYSQDAGLVEPDKYCCLMPERKEPRK